MKRVRRYSIVAVLVLVAILNVIPWTHSLVFEQRFFPSAFSRTWGWPMSAFANASDEGIELIEASVVAEGSIVFPDMIPGKYPHIAVNLTAVVIDLVVTACIVVATFSIATMVKGGGKQCDAPKSPPVRECDV
jgi:hypothetical protein